jgi:hypothetical protein
MKKVIDENEITETPDEDMDKLSDGVRELNFDKKDYQALLKACDNDEAIALTLMLDEL